MPFRRAALHASPPVALPAALVLGAACTALAPPASAELVLDPSSSRVTLLSTKVLADGSTSVVERFAFSDLVGGVGDDGAASVTIPLTSVETGIPIRNERMGEFLFETGTYPDATITAEVPTDALDGGSRRLDLSASLTLHGQTRALVVPVALDGDGSTVTVTATEPFLLDAAAHDLAGGIGKLAELAKLAHIPTTVPVSFTLTFVESDS